MKKAVMLVLALLLSSAAYGMIFSWTDSRRITHYTNREDEIPARYRAKAKHLYPDPSDTPAPQQNIQSQPAKTEGQLPIQQTRPDEQPKPQQPVLIPEPQKKTREPAAGNRRRRLSLPSDEE